MAFNDWVDFIWLIFSIGACVAAACIFVGYLNMYLKEREEDR